METSSASREKSCARLERSGTHRALLPPGTARLGSLRRPLPRAGGLGKPRHGAGQRPVRGQAGEMCQMCLKESRSHPIAHHVKRLFSPRWVPWGPAPGGCDRSRGFAERDGEPVGAGPVGLGAGGPQHPCPVPEVPAPPAVFARGACCCGCICQSVSPCRLINRLWVASVTIETGAILSEQGLY